MTHIILQVRHQGEFECFVVVVVATLRGIVAFQFGAAIGPGTVIVIAASGWLCFLSLDRKYFLFLGD